MLKARQSECLMGKLSSHRGNAEDCVHPFHHCCNVWLWKRLKLEVSDEKSKVTNLRKRDSEFLGFRIKLRRKSNSWVITSNVCDKAIHRIGKEMADSVKAIQSSKTAEEISLNVGTIMPRLSECGLLLHCDKKGSTDFSDIARQSMDSFFLVLTESKKQGEIKTDI